MIKPTLSRFCLYLCCTLIAHGLFFARLNSQTVIGGDTIDQSAVLDIQDTAKGVLLPRLTTVQRNAIVKPATGLMIFNLTEKGVQLNQGTPLNPIWVNLAPLPGIGNQEGNMLYWNGSTWIKINPGLPGQVMTLSLEGLPVWSGASFPTISTNSPSSITVTSATVSGNISADGGADVSARGIVWGTAINPTLSSSVLNLGSGVGTFSGTLSGLLGNNTYYVRAFATNSAGTAYGNLQSFTTLPPVNPTLSTNNVFSINQSSASVVSTILSEGGSPIFEKGVVWSTSPIPTTANSKNSSSSASATYTTSITGLTTGTTYFTRAFATNISGTGYGNELSFTTNISSLSCLDKISSGTLIAGVAASAVTVTIPYTGGNDGNHNGQTISSAGVTGLTASLLAGSFTGNTLTYSITGTPSNSGLAQFAISIGGQTCSLNIPVIPGAVTSLDCNSPIIQGTLTSGLMASGVSSQISYSGGNAGSHSGQTITSTGVNGLTATLSPGNFAVGTGTLTYTITGTPSSSGTASFAINIGGQTCTIFHTVIEGTVVDLNCAATTSGSLVAGVTASNVTFAITYSGGNGGQYNTRTVSSTGVTGLTASLDAGKLTFGTGNLVFSISGIPSAAGAASFTISLGGQNCQVNLSVIDGVSSLYCGSAVVTGTVIVGTPASGVSVAIPYDGGNGGSHSGQTINSTRVTGLTATLLPGNFAQGSGTLSYTISGTASSAGSTSFVINIGGTSCSLSIPVVAGGIATINCAGATNNGILIHGLAASGVSSVIPYTGGNGGSHAGQIVASTGVLGLTATLSAGNFATGAGNLTYTITGAPTSSGTASFTINIGGQICTLTRTVSVGSVASLVCGPTTGTLVAGAVASGTSFTATYTGGNGGAYGSQTFTSTGVTGLMATLAAGTFNFGAGTLTLTVTGTPTGSGNASFNITVGGQSCILVFPVDPGLITNLNNSCAHNTLIGGTLKNGVEAVGTTFTLHYTGGNGGFYNAQTIPSTGVTGLVASIPAGNFTTSTGVLTVTLSGTPVSSGTASFAITLGSETCTFSFAVDP
jgi:hypothetical protein